MVDVGKVREVKLQTESYEMQHLSAGEQGYKLFDYDNLLQGDVLTVNNPWSQNLTTEYNKLGLGSYTWTPINGVDDAVAKSQDSLIDLLRYYEGHGENYLAKTDYKDTVNVTTYGYGLTTTAMSAIGNYDEQKKKVTNKPDTQQKAYNQLLKYLNTVTLKETKVYLSSALYDSLPQCVKAAMLDYHFKNGYQIMSNSKLKSKLEKAQASNTASDWADVLREIVYSKPASSKAEKVDNPGLYRRSLSRVILAAKGLRSSMSAEDAAIIDKAVKDVYDAAVACAMKNNIGIADFDRIYDAYASLSTSTVKPEPQQQSGKTENQYVVPQQMGFFSAANAIIPDNAAQSNGIDSKTLRIAVINEILTLNNIQASGVDENGYPVVELLEPDTKLTMPDSVKVSNKTIRLQAPLNWEKVGEPQNNSNSESDDESIGVDESIRVLDLLYKTCSSPTYSNIGTDKDLQCATFKYKVQKGDTIYRLALRYGIDWRTLLADNGMTDKSILKIDDKIDISKIVYTVKKGDNLTQIAKRYGLTIDYIRDANNLEDVNELKVGQELEFPGYVYTVKKGDNLTQISKKVGVDINELGKLNGLKSPYIIQPGQKILVLFNDSNYNVQDSNKTTTTDNEGNTVVTVRSDNALLAGRPYLVQRKVNGATKATKHVFEPTGKGKLRGKTIIVNAGHGYKSSGAYDPGVPGIGGIDDEWLLNYDNSMRLISQLRARGAKVIYLQGWRNLVADELSNCGKVDMFISVHTNSASSSTKDRTQFYYRDAVKNDNSWGTRSMQFAEIAEKRFDNWIPKHEKIKDNEKFINGGKQDYAQALVNDSRTGILRSAISKKKVPSILWEVAFMSSAKGRERLSNSPLMDSYASVMADAVEEYFATYPSAPSGQPATSTKSATTSTSGGKKYKVKRGDTLSGIAAKHGVTVDQLKAWNGLKGNKIREGRVLIVKK